MNGASPRSLKMPLMSFRILKSTSSQSITHYDTLEVTQNATQEQIKSSYYRLSKQYHPDINKSENAKEKFRDISDAYEVIGNYTSRKNYDRGFLVRGSDKSDNQTVKDDPRMAFHKSRMEHHSRPIVNNNKKIYDFDEWTRAHYGFTLERTIKRKKFNLRVSKEVQERQELEKESEKELSGFIVVIIVVFFATILSIRRDNFDIVIDKEK